MVRGLAARLVFAVVLLGAPFAATSSGCFAVADLGRFHGASDEQGVDDPNVAWDLKLTLNGMGVHLNQLIEFRVIDSENYIQARGVIDPVDDLASATVTTRDGMAEICVDNLIAGVTGQPLRAWVNPDVAGKRRRG